MFDQLSNLDVYTCQYIFIVDQNQPPGVEISFHETYTFLSFGFHANNLVFLKSEYNNTYNREHRVEIAALHKLYNEVNKEETEYV